MVSFRSGETYLYFNVPEGIYPAMLSYDGPGTYFNRFIRDGFPNRHIGGEDEFLAVLDPEQIGSTNVYEENPELEMGADWIVRAEEEGADPEVIQSAISNMKNNTGISDLKVQQLLNRARQQRPFGI